MASRLLMIAAAAAALVAAAPSESQAAEFVPGEVIVRYGAEATGHDRRQAQRAAGVGRSEKLPGGSRAMQILDGESVGETLTELRRDPDVAYAVPNYVARTSFVPNDPGFLPGAGPGGWQQVQWNFNVLNAPRAWDLAIAAGAAGGRGVTVAVLDTGVAYENRGRYRRSPDLYLRRFARGYDFVSNDPRPNDENGHGTHVTSTIAERVNNGQGLTGLAYGAQIMPVRVLDSQGAGDSVAIARGIRYAARHGAKVINLSLEFDAEIRAAQVPDIVSAARYAHSKGAVIFAASGNVGSPTVAYPARTRYVVSVGATTERGCQAEYSNSGTGLDVVAPGGGSDAPVADNPYDQATCRPGTGGRPIHQLTFRRERRPRLFGFPGGYKGTSMAAPHVSATAALIIATGRLGPDPTPEAVEQRLKETARDLGPVGYDTRYGWGLIDTAAAIAP